MAGAVLLGLLFALGHHFFYASLHGTEAPSVYDEYHLFGASLSEQQTNTAIGTAFAFLVRACLIFAISLAYQQAVLWSAARESNRGVTVAHLDVLMSALGNLLALGTLSVWVRRPVLLLIAVMAWLVPIASIVTPATLSIGTHTAPSELRKVPQIALKSLNLVAEMPFIPYSPVDYTCSEKPCDHKPRILEAHYAYDGPSNTVRKIALATTAQGRVLNIEAPAPNSSWKLDFIAPTLRCSSVNETITKAIQDNVFDYTLNRDNCSHGPGYLSWKTRNWGLLPDTIDDMVPYLDSDMSDTWPLISDMVVSGYAGKASFFVAVFPSLMSRDINGESTSSMSCTSPAPSELRTTLFGPEAVAPTTILWCETYTSTHRTEFSFVNGVQEIHVDVTDLSDTPLISENRPCDYLVRESLEDFPCVFNATLLQSLSHQAISHAFAEMVLGKIQWTTYVSGGRDLSMEMTSEIASTVLTRSPELAWLRESDLSGRPDYSPLLQSIQPVWEDGTKSKFVGLRNSQRAGTGAPLKDMLEELFLNVTLSLMSEELLQYNSSSPFYPPPTNVTFSMRTNIYVYPAYKLWLAYGLAIGTTGLIVSFGLAAIVSNNASFNPSFSTWMRLSRGAELSAEIEQENLEGRDPLPRYLKELNVRFWREKSGEQRMEEEKLARSEVVDGEADQIELARFGDEVNETGGADRETSLSR
ncbi:hypothetical protein CBER1_03436 [Cercospora berteroae]|uniref:Uncharacterized protein n=1 Tax=Cercospora berteroae TaxID=357750 RepID=A0A2S6CLS0_9PEZI|nr:hypothetical protein CBER1_03436 [Cercospora berteroae]